MSSAWKLYQDWWIVHLLSGRPPSLYIWCTQWLVVRNSGSPEGQLRKGHGWEAKMEHGNVPWHHWLINRDLKRPGSTPVFFTCWEWLHWFACEKVKSHKSTALLHRGKSRTCSSEFSGIDSRKTSVHVLSWRTSKYRRVCAFLFIYLMSNE